MSLTLGRSRFGLLHTNVARGGAALTLLLLVASAAYFPSSFHSIALFHSPSPYELHFVPNSYLIVESALIMLNLPAYVVAWGISKVAEARFALDYVAVFEVLVGGFLVLVPVQWLFFDRVVQTIENVRSRNKVAGESGD